ncbi:MAG: hypothetical protein AAFY76_24960 [Cyanobacteria bacterium J06649_11]
MSEDRTPVGDNLWDKLKRTPIDDLSEKVEKCDGLTPEKLNKHKNAQKAIIDGHKHKIQIIASYMFSVVIGILITVFTCVVIWLFIVFAQDLAQDIEKTKAFLFDVLNAVLLVLATLFIDKVWLNKKVN